MPPAPRKSPMRAPPLSYAQRRRDEALQRQRAMRQERTDLARKVAMADREKTPELELCGPSTNSCDWDLHQAFESSLHIDDSRSSLCQAGPDRGEKPKQFYSKQLMLPEWMTDVPPDLASKWIVMPRPEGRRCLVTSASGITVSRLRSGSLLHRFQSALPSGSQDTAGPANSFCILDCVFQEGKNTYYVMDLMCWRGMSFYDCAAEFRLFWVQQKLAETEGVLDAACNEGYRFSSVPSCWCSPSGFSAAVRCEVPFVQDGLYLLHMDGYYMPGQSPLALLWKDASCSRYFLDTDGEGNVGEFQQVTLVYQGDGSLATGDTPPVALGRLPEDLQSSLRHKLKAGKLLRCTIREQGIRTEYGQPLSADLRFEEFANQRRGHADTVGKVLFQHNARKGLISHDTVVAELQEQQRQTSAYDSSTKAMQETEHLQGC